VDPMATGPSVLQYCLRNLRRFFALFDPSYLSDSDSVAYRAR
jgi:hypothetical protein